MSGWMRMNREERGLRSAAEAGGRFEGWTRFVRVGAISLGLGLLSTGWFFFLGTAGSAGGETRREDREAIRAHIDQIFRAYVDGDEETVRRTHAENWRGYLSQSETTIRGIDEYMRNAKAALASPWRVKDYEMREFDVVFYGDLAVVPYIATMKVGPQGGLQSTIRVLDVYRKEEGHWNQVASNVARHPETEAKLRQLPFPVSKRLESEILAARDAVWRAYFSGDSTRLKSLLPTETIAMAAEREGWSDRESILAASKSMGEQGVELLRLEFPWTEIQLYGDVAVLYTGYEFELSEGPGQPASTTFVGKGTEVFVRREGRWLNVGWHLDSNS